MLVTDQVYYLYDKYVHYLSDLLLDHCHSYPLETSFS